MCPRGAVGPRSARLLHRSGAGRVEHDHVDDLVESWVCARAGAGMSRPLAGIRVVVVDDEPCVRRVIGLILSRSGADVVQAASAEEALAALYAFRPHLIISDINMPVEDGYSLLRRIRALEASWAAQLPAIALTGGGGVAGYLEAQRAGFSAYLSKPIAPHTLVHTAVDLLQ